MIRRYTAKDFAMIKRWYKARKLPIPQEAALSDSGWIADERVAGFLYLTNSNIAMLDGVISDPNTLPSHRRQSLQQLCSVLVDSAVMLGYTNIIAATTSDSIKDICRKLRFRPTTYQMFILQEKDIEDDDIDNLKQL